MMQFKKSMLNKLKKATAFALVSAIISADLCFIHTESAYAASFNMGVENHWAEPFMRNLNSRGLMSGDKNGNMHPDKPITRAEFISIINRTFRYNKAGKNPFKDVKGSEWYADDIAIAYNQGYFSGDGKSTANAKGNLTREQAVALLGRNLKIEEAPGVQDSFIDGKAISSWSRGYVNSATDKGYISGYKDKSFKPKNYITRGEVAKVLSDAVGELINTSGTKYLGTQEGNVTIASSGVTLKDTIIKGDLYITEGVGLGHTYFENVHVLGDVIVSGTGESYAGKSSITFQDSTITNLIVDGTSKNIKSIKLNGNTIVDKAKIKSSAYLEELASRGGGFKKVELDGPKKTELHLSGLFDEVTVKGPENYLYLDKETIQTLIVDEEAVDSKVFLDTDTFVDKLYLDVGIEVSGRGEIDYLKVNAPGSEVSMLPDEIEIRPGLTANINGKDMTSKDAEEASDSPRILADYPEVDEIGPTEAVAKFKVNKPGTIYWAVTYHENGRPSKDEIISPGKYNSEVKKSGTLKVDSQKEYTAKMTGLEQESDYILSAVLVDDRDDRSDRETDYFSTLDNSKAGFMSGYPRVKDVADVSATLEYVANKDSDLYWAVYEKGRPAPDSRALKSQKLYGTVKNGVEEDCKRFEGDTLQVVGLKELNSYDCYILLSDGSNESSVTKLQFTTKDATPPQFNLGYPKITSSEKNSAEIGVSLNEEGLVYYAIYLGGTPFPVQEQANVEPPVITSEEAKQQIVKGKGAEKSGKSSNLKGDTPTNIKFSGLKPEEEYDVYLVAQDKSGNFSEIKKITIEAKPDFIEEYPQIRTVKNFSADMAINVTKNCKAYWAVLPKSSVAPNANNLKTQTVSGATNKGIVEECKKNEELILTVDNLKEFTEYEFYILVSDGLTDSEISKINFQTADLSAPIFANGYPVLDKVGDKSIDVKVKVDEDATIHYVLCKKSDTFPLPVPPSTEKPALDSDEAKNQVVLGNSGIKSGKINAKQNVEGKISLTGLTPETPYDLFIVAKDKFNNISNVVYMDIKTADFTAPKATLEFEETISGDVVAGSEIRIRFSEEVVDNATKKKLSAIDKGDLGQNIALYDLSALRRPAIDIDFTKVLVEDVDGATVVTFPKGILSLNSANTYEFELNKIADTSGNRMDEKTLLPSFSTVAPMVEILETISAVGMDMSFELIPQISETNDNIFYDIIFQSSEKVGFEVYEKPLGSATFTKVTSATGESVVIVEKDKSISLQNIKDKILDDELTYRYDKFKDLKQTEYGIRIVSINGETDRQGWESTINFGVKCVIGSISGLSPVSDNPTERFTEALNEGKVTVVNYPKDFNVKVYFTDTIVPAFEVGYPKLGVTQIGDTIVRPIVKTTKKATFYYLIAREGTVSNPTADGIMSGKYKPQDGVYGSFNVVSGQTEYEFRIEGLKPEVNYVMYCFLKGTPAATSSPMVEMPFRTVPVAPPKLDSVFVRDRLENSAIIEMALDKEADIDWIVFSQNSMPTDAALIANGYSLIRKIEENIAYRPIDAGSATAKITKGDSLARATITIYNIERDVYYNFYAVAKSPVGGGDSALIKVENITPADKTRPTLDTPTVITNYGNSYAGSSYRGTVTLTFSEPMFYIEKEGQPLRPLDINTFKEGLEIGLDSTDDSGDLRLEVISFKTASTDDGTRALISATVKFSNVYNNSVIYFPYALSDKNTNIAGYLYMKFIDMEVQGQNRVDSYWEHEFIS
ncbi:S-layer homology domain-containing protein [Anaerotignum sp. MB30-C6]|uniref:S-layer homology domain-containing protein n=1 Tax=Anaerotignum sp. MB30-C6 TaxID=3070814 RepID=UPI0027DD2788|nr:S-layer homology domain-containing protein [Anaerotignum sp. MB30-C6]WMI80997.1 S-layer homology domain-containing protein [Anaerotignum sp. MB30-C6]